MQVSTSQFKSGMAIIHEGRLYEIVEFQFYKPGKGGSILRTKLRDMKTKNMVDRTFDSGTKFESADIQEKKVQYLYHRGETYSFMDMESYEPLNIEKELLGKAINYIKENMEIEVSYFEDKVLDILLPITVELKVIHTEPGVRGDTARATYKPATTETGYIAQVPLFVKNDDIIRIDTRTGEYLERV